MMLEWELMNDWFLGRISFHRVSPVRVQMDILLDRAAQTRGAYPCQNALAIALRELGKLERTLLLLEYIRDVELRRRIHIGLNKGEARNALARGMFFNRLGELRDRTLENQQHRACGLNLVLAAIVLWNTGFLPGAGYSSAPQARADDP